MGQFAPVAPIQILESMKEKGALGTYHLLLAHHVLEYPDRFRALFSDLKQPCTIIMDNSIVELGDAASDALVLSAIQAIQSKPAEPHWITPVLTDVMGDGAATREAARISYDWWATNAPGWPLMAVAQGSNWQDFCQSVDYFLLSDQFPNIEYIGIPRVLVKSLGTRQLAIQYVDAVAPQTNIHLLGFSDDVTDDVICSNMPCVEGIDSAVPIRYSYSQQGTEGHPIYTPTSVIPPRPKNWFTDGELDEASLVNLFNIRKWCA